MLQGLLGGLFAPRPATLAGRRLFAAVTHQARRPELYTLGGVPDTPEGRFELYSLHMSLVLLRLKGQGPQAAETAQALFDAFLKNLDEGLREMGVGDLSVGKKMRKLGEALYGRLKSYDAAFQALPDRSALKGVIGRTMFGESDALRASALAAYAEAAFRRLAAEALQAVQEGELSWPEPGLELVHAV